jgi:hypothetical protein
MIGGARFVATSFKQDLLRTGWAKAALEGDSPHLYTDDVVKGDPMSAKHVVFGSSRLAWRSTAGSISGKPVFDLRFGEQDFDVSARPSLLRQVQAAAEKLGPQGNHHSHRPARSPTPRRRACGPPVVGSHWPE